MEEIDTKQMCKYQQRNIKNKKKKIEIIPLRSLNSLITKSKDTEMCEIPYKEFKNILAEIIKGFKKDSNR